MQGTLDDRSPTDALTVSTPTLGSTALPPSEEPAFLPGARFGTRYRIVELLGRGGMGEVYRADDLQLGQPVALKFLPRHLTTDETALARLRNEVRLARQVSHPNVCRVYDIGEVDGQYFLSMEFVDGEDLGSVLRRMGRPTTEKAVEIAHQLCLGLAAAHESGVLHRDLKPANVMIDGRGRVRITDFGVARLARELRGTEPAGGTIAYMAPELLRGSGSSPRSDIYSLGLVLYEVFTGKPAFPAGTVAELKRLHESTPTDPSALIKDLDPAIERGILRCLEADLRVRPASALGVARSLPGSGDPLTAALEAGETPSPEMVAAAGPLGGLRPVTGVALMVLMALGMLLIGWLAERTTVYGMLPIDKPFVVLQERAREVIESLGYEERPVDRHAFFNLHEPALQYFARQDRSAARWDPLTQPGQIGLVFLHRQSPRYLTPWNLGGRVTLEEPYPADGNIDISIGMQGRLLRFRAVPSFVDHEPVGRPPFDWSLLFDAAGLDIDDFEPTTPQVRPRAESDTQRAWSGVLPHRDNLPVRVEARALDGRPVFFETVTPYDEFWSPETARAMQPPATVAARSIATIVLIVLIAGGAVLLAVRNARLGRGDPHGALRLAYTVLVLRLLYWAVAGHHVPVLGAEISLLIVALGASLVLAALSFVLYMAIEPYFRRLRPEALVSWTRMLAGRWRDPLVGSHVLIGFAAGVGLHLLYCVAVLAPGWLGLPPRAPDAMALDSLVGGRRALGELFQAPLAALAQTLGIALLFLLLHAILRKTWLTVLTFCGIFAVLDGLSFSADPSGQIVAGGIWLGALFGAVAGGLLIALLMRVGLLATSAAMFMAYLVTVFPVTTDVGSPFYTTGLLACVFGLALALLAFRTSTAGRRLIPVEALGV